MSAINQWRIDYDDLGSTVYVREVPPWVTDELPGLYQSCYSVLEYFAIYDGAKTLSTCVLSEPRHIVMFAVKAHTAVVMNQLFDIHPESATRVVVSIFRSARRVKRVRFSGSRLEFTTLKLPSRELAVSCDVVIPLPPDVDTYFARLGRSTRQKLRNYAKHVAMAYSDHEFRVFGSVEIDEALVHRIIEMNRERMESKGEACLYSDRTEAQLAEFLRSSGFATAFLIDGVVVAGTLGSRLGTQRFLHVQSFDSAFAKQHLGWVSLFFTLTPCIDDGVSKLHLLWGKSEYKLRLGGVDVEEQCAPRASIARDSGISSVSTACFAACCGAGEGGRWRRGASPLRAGWAVGCADERSRRSHEPPPRHPEPLADEIVRLGCHPFRDSGRLNR